MDAFHRNCGSVSQGTSDGFLDRAASASEDLPSYGASYGTRNAKSTQVEIELSPARAVDGGVRERFEATRRMHLGRHLDSMARTVSERIVPRLVIAHRGGALPGSSANVGEEVVRLAERALASDVAGAARLIKGLLLDGHALDDLYLDLIAVAARHLGQQWHDDAISFVDVTIGMLALCRLLHEFDEAFCGNLPPPDPDRRMLLVARPGGSHELEGPLISAFLRRAGWGVTRVTVANQDELTDLLASNWYTLLGLSDSCSSIGVDNIASCIRAARMASQNRRLRVIVGGPAFAFDPELAVRVGANASACDARHAVMQAEGLLEMARRDS